MDKAEAYGKRRQTKEMNKEKHSNMLIKTFILKIQENKLNIKVKDALSLLFVEAKWYKNFILDYFLKNINNSKMRFSKIKEK